MILLFHPDEVERVRVRARGARPQLSIPSAVTLLRPDGLYYRGTDVTALAASHSYEQVAHLLWDGVPGGDGQPWRAPAQALAAAMAAQRALAGDPLPLERLQAAVTAVATTDPFRFDATPAAARRLAPSLITSMIAALQPGGPAGDEPAERGPAGEAPAGPGGATPAPASVAETLAGLLSGGRPAAGLAPVLDAALVLLADHELAASTVAVRVAAATGAQLYGCVAAGLGVLQGYRHGGTSLRTEDLLAQIRSPDRAVSVIHALLSRGDPLWGFGHPLYETGDPRAAMLLRLVLEAAPAAPRRTVEAVLGFASTHGLPPPNVDFALGALAHSWSLARGSGQAVFAVARTAGWVAHAIEEYEHRSVYRIRATYTGPPAAGVAAQPPGVV